MPYFKAPSVAGLEDSAQPSQEQDAQWGVAPPAVPRMASSLPATATATAQAAPEQTPNYGIGQQYQPAQAQAQAAPVPAQPAVIGSGGQYAGYAAPDTTLADYARQQNLDPREVARNYQLSGKGMSPEQWVANGANTILDVRKQMTPENLALMATGIEAAPIALTKIVPALLGGAAAQKAAAAAGAPPVVQMAANFAGGIAAGHGTGIVANAAQARMAAADEPISIFDRMAKQRAAERNANLDIQGRFQPPPAPLSIPAEPAPLAGDALRAEITRLENQSRVLRKAGDIKGSYAIEDRLAPLREQARAADPRFNPAPAPVTPPESTGETPNASPAGAGNVAADIADQQAAAGQTQAPPTSLESQLAASLKGKTPAPATVKTVGDMRAELNANGFNSAGNPSQVTQRYRAMVAQGANGIGTPVENVSNAAREAYNNTLEKTGDPEAARLAARKAAAVETAANVRAGAMTRAQADLMETLATEAAHNNAPKGTRLGMGVPPEALAIPGELIGLKATLSPPALRQGKVRLVTAPLAWARELKASFQAGRSETAARQIQSDIEKDPWVASTKGTIGGERPAGTSEKMLGTGAETPGALAAGQRALTGMGVNEHAGYTWKDVGGTILDWGEKATADTRVEDRVVQGETQLGKAVRAYTQPFDRQAAVEINLHRTNWYKSVAENMWQAGERDVERYAVLRRFIEHATHRGPTNRLIPPLWFSVRAQTGRALFLWDLASKVPTGIATGRIFSPGVEQEAAKALVGMTAANMAQMAALTASGLGSISYANGLPVWSNGKEHWDPWAGWGPQARLVVGVGKDIYKEYNFAKQTNDWGDVPQSFAHDLAGRAASFGRGGLSPAYSTLTNVVTGQDYRGQSYNLKKDVTSGGLLAGWTLPFIVEQLAGAYKESGPVAAAAEAVPSFLSEGLNSYQAKGDIRDEQAQKMGLPDYASAPSDLKRQIDDATGQERFIGSDHPTSRITDAEAALNRYGRTFGHTVYFNSLKRPLNQENDNVPMAPDGKKQADGSVNTPWANTRKAWADSKDLMDKYFTTWVVANQDTIAQKNFGKPFAELPKGGKEQTDIIAAIHEAIQKQNPDVDAWLAWWGGSDTLQTRQAVTLYNDIVKKYGDKGATANQQVHLAKGAQ